jgi:hypothetical protein
MKEILTEHGVLFVDDNEHGRLYTCESDESDIYVTVLHDGSYELLKRPYDSDIPSTLVRYSKYDETLEAIIEKWTSK